MQLLPDSSVRALLQQARKKALGHIHQHCLVLLLLTFLTKSC